MARSRIDPAEPISVEQRLAPADSPLGLLQRGRGAGALWALANPAAARPLLVECITVDPRWDHQVECRAGYYAHLALALALDPSALEHHLRTRDDKDDAYLSRLAVDTLCEMAERGSLEALSMVRGYLSYGTHWSGALRRLVSISRGGPSPVRELALAGLLPVFRARFATREALVGALGREWPEYEPWQEWARTDPAIAEALRLVEPATPKEAGPNPASLSTGELLAHSGVRLLQRELAGRTEPEDVAALLAVARTGTDRSAQVAAIRALNEQGHPALPQIALEILASAPQGPPRLRGALIRALSGLPADTGLPNARRWCDSEDFVLRRSAERLLARHACPEDVPLLRKAAQSEDAYTVCSAMEGFARLRAGGPYLEVRAVFDEHFSSRVRTYAASALANTDPEFGRGRAFESLWDCEAETRATGAAHVDRTLPGATKRLGELAEDHEPGPRSANARRSGEKAHL